MLPSLSTKRLSFLQLRVFILLPVVSAALIDAITLIFMNKITSIETAVNIAFSTLILFLPFICSHYLSWRTKGIRALLIWLAGFVAYPAMLMVFDFRVFDNSATVPTLQSLGLAWGASIFHRGSLLMQERSETRTSQWMSTLLSLNSVVALLLVSWATIVAAMFVSTVDPMNNQPIRPIIDSERVTNNLSLFLSYWLQFMCLATSVGCVYWLNRYVLIRNVLGKQGVFGFIIACIFCIIVFTPILTSIALLLPLNEDNLTLIPSENNNPFDPINFQVFFAILAVSTPVILAFERQQQNTAVEVVARQQTLTELKLLQQQINPHFLFNTLNNLYALTLKKSEDAPELLLQLANLLRYTVYEGQKPSVNLSSEIDYIKNYLALQRIRLAGRCEFNISLPSNCDRWLIPPLLLIVLIENAFKHGIEKSRTDVQLFLSIEIQGNKLVMQCENHVMAESNAQEAGGLGLENLRRRLVLLFADNFELVSKQHNNKWRSSLKLALLPC